MRAPVRRESDTLKRGYSADFELARDLVIIIGKPSWKSHQVVKKIRAIVNSGLFCCAFNTAPALSAEGGYTNYIPGFYGDIALAVEPADGLSLRNDVYFYSADTSRSVRSGAIEVDVDIDLTFGYATLLYKPGVEVFGAQWAYGTALVVGKAEVEATLSAGPGSTSFSDDKSSYGDITLIPGVFYWNNGDKWHFSQSFFIVVPVGDYDEDDAINTGLNYYTYETDFAATYLNPETGQDYSVVIGYGYNTENEDTDYQSGDEWHIDYIFNQFLSDSLAVGLHGFYYRQLSGDSGDGALLGDFKAEAEGIGPAIMWMPQKYEGEVAFVAKWINEYDAKNRLEGDHVFLSFMMSL